MNGRPGRMEGDWDGASEAVRRGASPERFKPIALAEEGGQGVAWLLSHGVELTGQDYIQPKDFLLGDGGSWSPVEGSVRFAPWMAAKAMAGRGVAPCSQAMVLAAEELRSAAKIDIFLEMASLMPKPCQATMVKVCSLAESEALEGLMARGWLPDSPGGWDDLMESALLADRFGHRVGACAAILAKAHGQRVPLLATKRIERKYGVGWSAGRGERSAHALARSLGKRGSIDAMRILAQSWQDIGGEQARGGLEILSQHPGMESLAEKLQLGDAVGGSGPKPSAFRM